MTFTIVGNHNINALYCAGSFSKLTTTYVCLAKLAEQKFDLSIVLDEPTFFDALANNNEAKAFLKLFQTLIGSQFSFRDLCSFYSGLPYTFNLSHHELDKVELGLPFKHHSILDEETFLDFCHHQITPVYKNRCKFHYSEIAIIFLGYFFEKCFSIEMETLYQKHLINKFNLPKSAFSRKRLPGVICKDLSPRYDYPSVGILDHGYFCYSNGFYTTLSDLKNLLEQLMQDPVFSFMSDIKKAHAASGRLMNGLTVEMRLVEDDMILGYEGYSFSGCNIWNYSTKTQRGLISFTDDEEEAYRILYDDFGYTDFLAVPDYTQQYYQEFLANYPYLKLEDKAFPKEFIGKYLRVDINDTHLETEFELGEHHMRIRNPELITYPVVYLDGVYRVRNKDKVHGAAIGLYESKTGMPYFLYDGTLYRKI